MSETKQEDNIRTINVLYIVSGINSFGGIESFCRVVVPKIDFSKYHIDFLITENEPEGDNDILYRNMGSRIYRIDSNGGLFERVKHKKEFFKNLKTDYDIVHIHTVFTTAYYFAKLAIKYTNAKVIIHSHTANNYDKSALKNKLCRPLLNKYADYRVACSRNAAEFLFGKRKGKTADVIYNPVDLDKFKFNEMARKNIREELGLYNEVAYLIVGRLATAKNHTYLINVFYQICKERSDCKLIICGDGEKRNEIEKQISDLQLIDKVILLGNRRNVNEIMSASDCFVLPSLYEGLPIVLIEAQVNGLPIVISNNITSEVVIDETSISLPLNDINLWKDSLMFMSSIKKRSTAKPDLMIKVADKFGAVQIASYLQEVYTSICND